MRIINALLANWKTKTKAEKAKTILHGIAMIGGGVIGGGIGDKFAVGRSRLESVCVRVTGWALGSAAADVASKVMDETVDQLDGLMKDAKSKEGTANG